MKKQLIALMITSTMAVSNVSYAQTSQVNQASPSQEEEAIGLGSGLVIGAIVGGPIGAFVGAVIEVALLVNLSLMMSLLGSSRYASISSKVRWSYLQRKTSR